MSHERVDYEDENDLERFLTWDYYADTKATAFDPEIGVLVALHVSLKGEKESAGNTVLGNSLGIQIYDITVCGAPVRTSLFGSKAHGEIEVFGGPACRCADS